MIKTKIKLIIFDLDGVLADIKKIHFDSLNMALGKKYEIKWEDHLKNYDGLSTNKKLDLLVKRKKLPKKHLEKIWEKKQEVSFVLISKVKKNVNLIKIFKHLKKNNFKIALCSNSIKKTAIKVLENIGIHSYFDTIFSNQDVKNPKPHPEIFYRAMIEFNALPEETIIIEDSPKGLLAANRSNANLVRVKNSFEINLDFIKNVIKNFEKKINLNINPIWEDKNLNVVIPMAGEGSRFKNAGYTFPKPLVEINGKPMIQLVVENLGIKANFIFIVLKHHRKKYNFDHMLKLISPNCKIIEVSKKTEGAACTVLLAKKFINNSKPVFFANSDQHVVWNSNEFFYKMNENDYDGGIVTFKSTHPKWSYAKTGKDGLVKKVAEKKPISDNATVGFYYWKMGKDFVNSAEQMIKKNIRVNGEFYLCPVFNETVKEKKRVAIFDANEMWGLGTPEDLIFYLNKFKNDTDFS